MYKKKTNSKIKNLIFNTISKEYLRSLDIDIADYFPYILTKRSGASIKLIQLCHNSIMQPNGLAPCIKNILCGRKNRFLMLLRGFTKIVNKKKKVKILRSIFAL